MKTAKLFGLICASILACSSMPVLPVSAGKEQDQGVVDGYNWELWNQYGQGNATMEVGNGGTYTCTWSGIHNILFRSGRKFSDYPQWKTLDSILLNYEASVYKPNGNSYLCVYGWTKSPLVEYYIVENYGSWRPPGESKDMHKVGTITVDDGTYEVYKGIHNGPSIEPGVETFDQYWSVRVDGQLRNSGTIDIAKHFDAWENKFNMKMGGLYEVALNVEGWESSGTATISKNELILDGSTPGPSPQPEPEVKYTEPSGQGSGTITDDFEGSGTVWAARGDKVKYGFTEDFVHNGKQALYITGREASWNGVSASGSELKAGGKYHFSSYVGYKNDNYDSLKYELGLQYKLDGDMKYDNLGSASASAGKWAELSADISVPEGATDIAIYVQSEYAETTSAKDKISFFLDDVKLESEAVETTAATTTVTTTLAETTTTTAPVTTTITTTSSEEAKSTTSVIEATKKGDVDCNGSVDVSDAVLLARFVAEDSGVTITATGRKNADIDSESGLQTGDVIMILKAIAKLVTL